MAQAALAFAGEPSVTPFNFGAHAVRVVLRDGEPWFVAADVADALGYRDAANAGRILADHQKGTHTMSTHGGEQRVIVVNESGLYRLVLRSRKPEAEKFSDWVTGEVLPAIRKTGGYSVELKPIDPAALLLTGQSKPTVALTAELQRAIDSKAFEMATEAFELCRKHLERRVAYNCEQGQPRYIDSAAAMRVIADCTLGNALAQKHYEQLERVTSCAAAAKATADRFFAEMNSAIGMEVAA